jgi:hypothetical protein
MTHVHNRVADYRDKPLLTALAARLARGSANAASAVCLDLTDGAVYASPRPGEERRVLCPWCLEDAGWCAATGGANPCEGEVDQAAALVDHADAPELTIHTGRVVTS